MTTKNPTRPAPIVHHVWNPGAPSDGSDGLPYGTSRTLTCRACGLVLTARRGAAGVTHHVTVDGAVSATPYDTDSPCSP